MGGHSALDGHAVELQGHGFAPHDVELVTIRDVEPYIRGAREGDEGGPAWD